VNKKLLFIGALFALATISQAADIDRDQDVNILPDDVTAYYISNHSIDEQQAQYNQLDKYLNETWAEMPKNVKAHYRQQQCDWIKYKDALPLVERIIATRHRIEFLQTLY
jgi:hypothetical protein